MAAITLRMPFSPERPYSKQWLLILAHQHQVLLNNLPIIIEEQPENDQISLFRVQYVVPLQFVIQEDTRRTRKPHITASSQYRFEIFSAMSSHRVLYYRHARILRCSNNIVMGLQDTSFTTYAVHRFTGARTHYLKLIQ
jgi:hypothetical protein